MRKKGVAAAFGGKYGFSSVEMLLFYIFGNGLPKLLLRFYFQK